MMSTTAIDRDRHRAEQPRHQRQHHRNRAEPNPRRPQPTAFTQIPGHYLKEFGEYRTQRYVRRAFDQLERGELPGLNG